MGLLLLVLECIPELCLFQSHCQHAFFTDCQPLTGAFLFHVFLHRSFGRVVQLFQHKPSTKKSIIPRCYEQFQWFAQYATFWDPKCKEPKWWCIWTGLNWPGTLFEGVLLVLMFRPFLHGHRFWGGSERIAVQRNCQSRPPPAPVLQVGGCQNPQFTMWVYIGCGPLTGFQCTFLVGDPYKPSFPTVTGRGPHPRYIIYWFSLREPDLSLHSRLSRSV